jgi:hypothetical protein
VNLCHFFDFCHPKNPYEKYTPPYGTARGDPILMEGTVCRWIFSVFHCLNTLLLTSNSKFNWKKRKSKYWNKLQDEMYTLYVKIVNSLLISALSNNLKTLSFGPEAEGFFLIDCFYYLLRRYYNQVWYAEYKKPILFRWKWCNLAVRRSWSQCEIP